MRRWASAGSLVAAEFTAIVPVAVMPDTVRLPERRALPCTESVEAGVVVPTPTLPLAVAKAAYPLVVSEVEEAYVAVRRLPDVKVRSVSSVKAPAVVMNGILVVVSAETVRLVVEAVPK